MIYNFCSQQNFHLFRHAYVDRQLLAVCLHLSAFMFFMAGFNTIGFSNDRNIGKVIAKNPSVIVLRNGVSLAVDGFGKILHKGDIVITRQSGKAHVILISGSELFLAPSAKLEITEQLIGESKQGIKRFIFDIFGKIRLQIKKTKKKQLRIKTQTAVIAIKGTDFIVSYENGTTTVATIEGLVNMVSIKSRQTIDIPSGKMSSISLSGEIMPLSEISGEILKGVDFAGERLTESDISGEPLNN